MARSARRTRSSVFDFDCAFCALGYASIRPHAKCSAERVLSRYQLGGFELPPPASFISHGDCFFAARSQDHAVCICSETVRYSQLVAG